MEIKVYENEQNYNTLVIESDDDSGYNYYMTGEINGLGFETEDNTGFEDEDDALLAGIEALFEAEMTTNDLRSWHNGDGFTAHMELIISSIVKTTKKEPVINVWGGINTEPLVVDFQHWQEPRLV